MPSSEKKRAREQRAAARRDRVAQRRSDKASLPERADASTRIGYNDTPTLTEAEAEPAERAAEPVAADS